MTKLEEMLSDLKNTVSSDRYEHSLRVMEMAERLAIHWGYKNIEKCIETALMHDAGKLKSIETVIQECKKRKIKLNEEDLKCPQVIHAYLSENIVREKYNFDEEQCLAVRSHTIGSENMGILEKIVFTADMIEDKRTGIIYDEIRKTAFENLDMAVIKTFNATIEYNQQCGRYVHKQAIRNRDKMEESVNGIKRES